MLSSSGPRKLTVCFDVACPYAYLAMSRMPTLVEAVRDAANTAKVPLDVEFKPVLLGGLYDLTAAPQGKAGSATDVMPDNKKALLAADLRREAQRWGVTLNWNPKHPIRTLDAQRLLCGVNENRLELALALYKAYWVDGKDVSDIGVLGQVASAVGVSKPVQSIIDSEQAKSALTANTSWAADKGAFGVPTMVVRVGEEERLFFGQDRTFFVAQALGLPRHHPLAHPLRLHPIVNNAGPGKVDPNLKLTVFHDFSSPWSFLGMQQVEQLARDHGAQLEVRPILLGALFRSIGTPNVPMLSIPPVKRAYGAKEMKWFCAQLNDIDLKFPEGFPIRTVMPLRISIVEPKTIQLFYHAAWIQGKNIGEEDVLREVLASAGLSYDHLAAKANAPEVKEALKRNTADAIDRGACGVPTFQVNDSSDVVWGQDRLNVVSDFLSEAKRTPASL